jgi:hypothetical protein
LRRGRFWIARPSPASGAEFQPVLPGRILLTWVIRARDIMAIALRSLLLLKDCPQRPAGQGLHHRCWYTCRPEANAYVAITSHSWRRQSSSPNRWPDLDWAASATSAVDSVIGFLSGGSLKTRHHAGPDRHARCLVSPTVGAAQRQCLPVAFWASWGLWEEAVHAFSPEGDAALSCFTLAKRLLC